MASPSGSRCGPNRATGCGWSGRFGPGSATACGRPASPRPVARCSSRRRPPPADLGDAFALVEVVGDPADVLADALETAHEGQEDEDADNQRQEPEDEAEDHACQFAAR